MTRLDYAPEREIIDRFAHRRVLVVGDVILDRFIWGEVERISPEAPVPVVRVARETTHLGGAANVAANLRSLGAAPHLVGLIGLDAPGARLRSSLAEERIGDGLVEDPARTTTVKTRIIARAQQVVRVDREQDGPPSAAKLAELKARVLEALSATHALVISDYGKGVLSRELLAVILPEARRRGLPVVVDPKLPDFSRYQPATVITPNQAEAARAARMEIRSDEDCLLAARSLLESTEIQAILVTRGDRGMLVLERGRVERFIPAVAREVYDVTGAGDTVVAVTALALAAGGSLQDAASLANRAAGIVVGKVGTATVSATEL